MGMGVNKEMPTGEGHFILGNIFYSSTNFRGRLDLLDHMFKRLILDPALAAEWRAVKNKASILYARRNVLAHGMAWGNETAGLDRMRYSIFSTQGQSMDYQQMIYAAPSFCRYAERITQLAINANAYLARRKGD